MSVEGVNWKSRGTGMQPASLTPVSTELTIHGSDERLVIPCLTSTKVAEIKEMIAQKVGCDTSEISLVARQGCAHRKQYDHEEVRRQVSVTGIDSFVRKKATYDDPFVIIGAGHVGLRHGLWLMKHKSTNFVIFDRRSKVGGTSWIAQANRNSKLQTEMGTYHLQYDEDNPIPKNMSTWPSRDELLQHFAQVSEEYGLMPYVKLNMSVKRVEFLDPKAVSQAMVVHIEATDGKYEGVLPPESTGMGIDKIRCDAIFMYPGNLSFPRKEPYMGEDTFGGDIVYAMFDAFDYEGVRGQNVVIVGHGAFAVENVRTCCEYSAKQIYMVCRRRNLACPRFASWFVNQSDPALSGAMFMKALEPMYALTPWDPWTYHSVISTVSRSNAAIQQKARFGIGDVYFLAVYMQKCEVIVDGVKRLTQGTVHLGSGRKLEAPVILKLLGFEGDFEVDRLLKIKEVNGFWVNGDYRRYTASEGPGVSASNFGGTSLSPGAISWVAQGTHMMWYPSDFKTMINSGMLPVHQAELEKGKPAYMLDATIQTAMGFIIPALCPLLGEMSAAWGQMKRRKQLACHPMQAFIDEAAAEWDEYGRSWKAEYPSHRDPPPYPYDYKTVQAFLDMSERQKTN
mmetsp:Transcript_21850/g.61079  ORF Transcript_21850/g.61079 Transcript_21850/m.61079 type:complete len:622 (+) Transcript_21850:86-1951(+)